MRIDNLKTLKVVLRNGNYTDIGGYPLFIVDEEGDAYHVHCVRHVFRSVVKDTKNNKGGYIMKGVEVNWENKDLECYICHKYIESAYGE